MQRNSLYNVEHYDDHSVFIVHTPLGTMRYYHMNKHSNEIGYPTYMEELIDACESKDTFSKYQRTHRTIAELGAANQLMYAMSLYVRALSMQNAQLMHQHTLNKSLIANLNEEVRASRATAARANRRCWEFRDETTKIRSLYHRKITKYKL